AADGGTGGTAGSGGAAGSAGTSGSGGASGSGGTSGSGGASGSGGWAGSGGDGGFSGSGGWGGDAGWAGGGGAGGARGWTSNRYPCVNPTPVGDGTTGYEQCAGGFTHRAKKLTCPSKLPRDVVQPAYDGGVQQCTKDTDCTEKPHGYCDAPVGWGYSTG